MTSCPIDVEPGSSSLPPVGVVVFTKVSSELPGDSSAEPDHTCIPFIAGHSQGFISSCRHLGGELCVLRF